MILTISYNQLINLGVVVFFLYVILIVWAAIVWSDDISKRTGEPTFKEWLKDFFKGAKEK